MALLKKKTRPSPWPFLGLTFAWSWAIWVPTILWLPDTTHLITQAGFALGGLGPMIFGIYFTWREGGRKALREYGGRVRDGKRLGVKGWVLALLVVPALTLLAGWMDRLFHGEGLRLDLTYLRYFTNQFAWPLAIPILLVFILLFGPLPEELGWRGYALDRLRLRRGPLGASLILGFFWGLWLLPSFFLRGANQATPDPVGFLLFFAGILPLSVVMTWLYDLTGRSILSAILFHFSNDGISAFAPHGNRVELLRVLFCWAWALLIILQWRKRAKRPRNPSP